MAPQSCQQALTKLYVYGEYFKWILQRKSQQQEPQLRLQVMLFMAVFDKNT
jgi:hypothetical protein